MNPLEYLVRKINGLPTVDSIDLIKARMQAGNATTAGDLQAPDLHFRPTDPAMFGAISPIPEEEDFMSSQELHERTEDILRRCGIE